MIKKGVWLSRLWILTVISAGLSFRQEGSFLLAAAENEKTAAPRLDREAAPRLDREAASRFAKLALSCIQKEYPNKLDHVMNDRREVQGPRRLHPAFYGCFDWHSSVHGHWMLARLLRLFPDLPEAVAIRRVFEQNLSAANIRQEVAYFGQKNRKSFERTYGWAWLLKLAEELGASNDPQVRRWSANLQPLADTVAAAYVDFFPRQTYPIRTGVHPNTAFAMAFGLDYARQKPHPQLEALLLQRAREYYGNDRMCPASWEPGGEDFFSPCLIEADLMRRVLPPAEFVGWLDGFLHLGTPIGSESRAETLFNPAVVSDRSDPKIVHLDGLNLSRAWCLYGIATALSATDSRRQVFLDAAKTVAASSLPYVTSGEYGGEHWLGTFAVYMLDQAEKAR